MQWFLRAFDLAMFQWDLKCISQGIEFVMIAIEYKDVGLNI